ncbi:MAG: hypothetical protein O9302_02030 [Cyclobacteriaceae bacterium]|jgi:hypothetical protein|nr:hypothetical protein [Cytophagales bacterium]MCZ8326811.1 hypothetical protein [Cyclobacteriaceae bacterium]
MNKARNYLLLFCITLLLSFTCSDDPKPINNLIKYDGTQIEISSAIVYFKERQIRPSLVAYYYNFLFYDDQFTLKPDNKLVGIGDAFVFSIYSDKQEFPVGNFLLNSASENLEDEYVFDPVIFYSYNTETNIPEKQIAYFEQSKVSITKEDDVFTIEFRAIKDNKELRVSFKGRILVSQVTLY